MVSPGEIVDGRYRVDEVLGAGGMGVVVAATHLALGQRVALKCVHAAAMEHPETVPRFLREARAAVTLRSEHVGRVLDVGQLAGGAPYMVMEFLEGADLGRVVKGNGALPHTVAAEYVLQACEAIAEAHAAGIIHRDIKPANLFLTRRADGSPIIKVLDFGISKVAADPGASLTHTSAVFGSPGYMSPEQMRASKDVEPTSDIWSLGVVLFELVAGKPPFLATTFAEQCLKIAVDPTPTLTSPGNPVPAAFRKVVERCLEKDPRRRFATVADLARALSPFAPNGKEAAARVRRVTTPTRPPTPIAAGRATETGKADTTLSGASGQLDLATLNPPRRRKVALAVAGVAVALGAAAAIVVTLSSGKGGGPSAAPAAAPVTAPPAAGSVTVDLSAPGAGSVSVTAAAEGAPTAAEGAPASPPAPAPAAPPAPVPVAAPAAPEPAPAVGPAPAPKPEPARAASRSRPRRGSEAPEAAPPPKPAAATTPAAPPKPATPAPPPKPAATTPAPEPPPPQPPVEDLYRRRK